MNDSGKIANLVGLAKNPGFLQNMQHLSARKLLSYDGEIYPRDGCAITLCTLMQYVGIAIPDIYTALALGRELMNQRNWTFVAIGSQREGDVGSTCGTIANHGFDHIYFVLQNLNGDEMVIADNQDTQPHFRYASGKGRTPTTFFLRPSDGMMSA